MTLIEKNHVGRWSRDIATDIYAIVAERWVLASWVPASWVPASWVLVGGSWCTIVAGTTIVVSWPNTVTAIVAGTMGLGTTCTSCVPTEWATGVVSGTMLPFCFGCQDSFWNFCFGFYVETYCETSASVFKLRLIVKLLLRFLSLNLLWNFCFDFYVETGFETSALVFKLSLVTSERSERSSY